MIRFFQAACVLLLLLRCLSAAAVPVETRITGVEGEMRTNVEVSLSLKRAESLDSISIWRLRQMSRDARDEVGEALQAFGYYSPNVSVRLSEPEADGLPWRATVAIEPGEAVRVHQPKLNISGTAREVPAFREWLSDWPLPDGSVLRHPPYTESLSRLEQIAEAHGFFEGRFVKREIRVERSRNRADITVDYNAGPRYTIGQIDYGDTGFNDDLMRALTIVEPGQAYTSDDIDRQREVLARAGYFEQVIVAQQRRPEDDAVDLSYELEKRLPNTYRVLAGFGTDTGVRGQLGWTRHYLSNRGDQLDTRLGAQQTDSEFVLRSDYKHPFGTQPGNFLTGSLLLKRERDRFRFQDEDQLEPVFDDFGGNRNQAQMTAGRLRERPLFTRPFSPLIERLFVTFLNEQFDAFSQSSLNAEQEALIRDNPELRPFLDTDTNTVAVGGDWRLSRLSGTGFATDGFN
ncbi:MAG: autotransporter assembly complex family protein, partial [Wenzhouxiangellaceae bacterium]